MSTSVMYKLTVTDSRPLSWRSQVEQQVVSLGQLGPMLTSMIRDKVNPDIKIEQVDREVLDRYAINENPYRPASLVLKPWGTCLGQVNKINAIKALRMLDPGKPNLKEAKDAVELGLEIFTPWDLSARVAQFLADGLCADELYVDVCARVDEGV